MMNFKKDTELRLVLGRRIYSMTKEKGVVYENEAVYKKGSVYKNGAVYLALIVGFVISCIFCSCQVNNKPPTILEEGHQLALSHCSSCHLSPDPSLLDKLTWTKHVLPAMAPKLGIGIYQGNQYFPNPQSAERAPLSLDEWFKIVNYFNLSAPAILKPASGQEPLRNTWSIFKLKKPALDSSITGTCMVTYDSSSKTIISADAFKKTLTLWDSNLKEKKSYPTESPVVNAFPISDNAFPISEKAFPVSDKAFPVSHNESPKPETSKSKFIFTSIGILFPSDHPKGVVEEGEFKENKIQTQLIGDKLIRPVQTLVSDFNKDGIKDYAVCSFGNKKGGLFVFTGQKNGTFKRTEIRGVAGAEQEVVGDFNHDGWPDLIVLFAQADEGIWMFLNDKKGGFKTINLLRFPPVYGSTSFQLCDFNHDGKPDILYTCGDNADFSPVLKPYHGVYIFENQGNWKFTKKWFYPVNGCMKALVADFNKDGKMDIASISFFPDFKNRPGESFIYFEQVSPYHFIPNAIPVSDQGHWLTMATADINHDGCLDIILGSFNYPAKFGAKNGFKMETKRPFIVLENNQAKGIKP